MHDHGRISPLQRAALLTIGLLPFGLSRIVIPHRQPMLTQTHERSHTNAPTQPLIHWLVLCSALRTALVSSGAARPI
jgi:hypothetical protein